MTTYKEISLRKEVNELRANLTSLRAESATLLAEIAALTSDLRKAQAALMPKAKKGGNHVWVVESFDGGKWNHHEICRERKRHAVRVADGFRADDRFAKVRVWKYVAAKEGGK